MCFTNKCKYELSDGRCEFLRKLTIQYSASNNFQNYIKKFEIQKNEILCPDCKGRGLFTFKREVIGTIGEYLTLFHTCTKCKGRGKIDWVDNLIVKEDHYVRTGQIPKDSYCSTNDINLKGDE